MFPSDYHAEIQVIINLISHDPEIMPDALAGLAASSAIAISDIPFGGPISEVRVALLNGNYVINPSKAEVAKADMEMLIAGTASDITMVEGEMNECSEDQMLEAIKVGHEAIKKQIQAQKELAALVEKSKVSGNTTTRTMTGISSSAFTITATRSFTKWPSRDRQSRNGAVY